MRVILLLLLLSLTSCTHYPPANVPKWVGSYRKACLPEAITVTEGLKERGIQAKVLSIHTKDWGHATCVYLYPPGKNKLWVWDSKWQSVNLRAWWHDPQSVAQAWMNWRYDETPITNAYYLDENTL